MTIQQLCECGCGEPSPLASKTFAKRGWVKGQSIRFINGHGARKRVIPISFLVCKDTGCWLWQGSKISTGYGNLRIDGKTVLAHRYMYENIKGLVPEGMELDHLCRTPLCINPAHLEAVTHAENCRRGKRAKLSHRDVQQIKQMKKNGQRTDFIAVFYSVDRSTIDSVLRGKAWS